jgi:tetratricopeptide (TPR) repeat protein
MTNPTITKSQRVRFEEVTPTNEIVVYFNAQLPDLLAGTGLPIFPGYDDLDSIQFAYITLPSGNTVVLGQYGNAPEIGVDLYVEFDKNNSTAISTDIPALVVETLRYLAIPRETAVWFHPDYETEIELLYARDVEFESIPKIPTAELTLSTEYEPIDCFYHALEIYTREKLPEHWAMLQHNLGLAYFDRIKGERWENLQKSIECFNKSIEVFTQDKFPEKWQINQEDLIQSQKALKTEEENRSKLVPIVKFLKAGMDEEFRGILSEISYEWRRQGITKTEITRKQLLFIIDFYRGKFIYELQDIPEDKLTEIYNLIHDYRLGLGKEQTQPRIPVLIAGILGEAFFEPLSEEELQQWE